MYTFHAHKVQANTQPSTTCLVSNLIFYLHIKLKYKSFIFIFHWHTD